MSRLHAVIVEQATELDAQPPRASLVATIRGYRLASVMARFVVSATLVGGVALSFAFGDNDGIIASGSGASQAR